MANRKLQIANLESTDLNLTIRRASRGFTLVEMTLVVSLFAILTTFATITLVKPQTSAAVDASLTPLIADLKQQQLKAMVGETNSQNQVSRYGILFQTNSYVLFAGDTYNAADASNITIALDSPLQLTTTLPSSQVVFDRLSGDVMNFNPSANTITITNTATNEAKMLTINPVGVVTHN